MTTTPVPHAQNPNAVLSETPHPLQHPDATDRIVVTPHQSFGQTMSSRSTEFKNALIAGGVGIAVAFLAAGFGLGYWAGDAGSTSTPQSGFSQTGGGQAGGGQFGGQAGGGQFGGAQTGSGQTGSGQTGGTQNGVPGGSFGGQTQGGSGTGTGTAPGAGTGATTGTGSGTSTTTS